MKDLEIQKFIILQDIYNEQASLNSCSQILQMPLKWIAL